MKNYKHLFFDLDRTLWDFETNTAQVFAEIFTKHNLQNNFKNLQHFETIYNKHNDVLWALYRESKIKKDVLRGLRFFNTLEEVGAANKETAEAIGHDYVRMGPEMTGLFPGTIEILEYLSKKYKLYIITNGFKEVQHAKVERCGLSRFFVRVFTSEDIGIQKPRPEIFRFALSSVNAKKDESLMIGDDLEVDVMGAKRFGINQVWFNPHKIEISNSATYEINNLLDLKKIL